MDENPYAAPTAREQLETTRSWSGLATLCMTLLPLGLYLVSFVLPMGSIGHHRTANGWEVFLYLFRSNMIVWFANVLFFVVLWRLWMGDWFTARVIGVIGVFLALFAPVSIDGGGLRHFQWGGWLWFWAQVLAVALTVPVAMIVEGERKRRLRAMLPQSKKTPAKPDKS